MIAAPELGGHRDGDGDRPFALWRLTSPTRSIASAPLGGGIGLRSWVLNAQVGLDYGRLDPDRHAADLAEAAGATGVGVGMLTAAHLELGHGEDGGVQAWATVGVTAPTWAADRDGAISEWVPGTINVVVAVPAALTDPALVNAVMTVTEAKSQALFEAGVPGTGTATDAVCVLVSDRGEPEPFAGPRSTWGARVARAVHVAVAGRLP